MSGREDFTHIRIYKENMKALWDHVNFENKTMADVIKFLLQAEEETREFRQSLQSAERSRLASEILERPV